MKYVINSVFAFVVIGGACMMLGARSGLPEPGSNQENVKVSGPAPSEQGYELDSVSRTESRGVDLEKSWPRYQFSVEIEAHSEQEGGSEDHEHEGQSVRFSGEAVWVKAENWQALSVSRFNMAVSAASSSSNRESWEAVDPGAVYVRPGSGGAPEFAGSPDMDKRVVGAIADMVANMQYIDTACGALGEDYGISQTERDGGLGDCMVSYEFSRDAGGLHFQRRRGGYSCDDGVLVEVEGEDSQGYFSRCIVSYGERLSMRVCQPDGPASRLSRAFSLKLVGWVGRDNLKGPASEWGTLEQLVDVQAEQESALLTVDLETALALLEQGLQEDVTSEAVAEARSILIGHVLADPYAARVLYARIRSLPSGDMRTWLIDIMAAAGGRQNGGVGQDVALDSMRELLADPDPELVQVSSEAAHQLGARGFEVVPQLMDVVMRRSRELGDSAILALGTLAGEGGEHGLSILSQVVSAEAAVSPASFLLALDNSRIPDAAHAAMRYLGSADADVRACAVRALKWNAGSAAILASRIQDNSVAVRLAAVESLAHLGELDNILVAFESESDLGVRLMMVDVICGNTQHIGCRRFVIQKRGRIPGVIGSRIDECYRRLTRS